MSKYQPNDSALSIPKGYMNPEEHQPPVQVNVTPQGVSHETLDLKLKALKSDLRLLIIASVALNQFLSHVALPTSVSAPAVGVAILAPALKSLLFRN